MERAGGNNHGVCCDVMLAAFSLYVGDMEKAREVISEVPQRRIDTQIAPDGSQPQELRRTLSFHYSIYNLNFFADLCMLAHRVGVNLEDYVSTDGRSLYQALNFLSPYMGKSVEEWPYKQIHGWGEKQQDLARLLYRYGHYMHAAPSSYEALYRQHRNLDLGNRFHLLWYDASLTDHAYVSAAHQLELLSKESNALCSKPCRFAACLHDVNERLRFRSGLQR